jgi:pimeloyl-ACP methyl ester carboxylesterase
VNDAGDGLVSTPVLLLWGESDGIAPVPYGQAYADSFPDAGFQPIPGAGHLPQVEQPALVMQHIRSFASETGHPVPA